MRQLSRTRSPILPGFHSHQTFAAQGRRIDPPVYQLSRPDGRRWNVKLLTRRQGTQEWKAAPAAHARRSVYSARLRIFIFAAGDGAIEYLRYRGEQSEDV